MPVGLPNLASVRALHFMARPFVLSCPPLSPATTSIANQPEQQQQYWLSVDLHILLLLICCSWLFNPSLLAIQSVALGYSIHCAWLFNPSLLAIQSVSCGSLNHCS
ncbi:hypothetical protein PGTUg99_033476 [Puccinia graminis f. sp. tritici]|uniref:Uncharacterized protein n=1 Tax=Puccinia graminis f. sp. tritici TaxID=56615 RepID=A0A5B0R874_PUCGR|nr:hypothetical protein PGTUg99_033476 [Puccinia graminis f. sp. tritici]